MNTSSFVSRFVRRSAALATTGRSVLPCVTAVRSVLVPTGGVRFTSSHVKEDVPAEDYYDGHLMADHLEYLDDMIEKTVKLKESMESLKQTKAQAVASGVKWIEAEEIDRLFDTTAKQKAELANDMIELQKRMASARKTGFAVDAPDGYSDGYIKEELNEIKHIIDDAAVLEDQEKIKYEHEVEDKIRKERARDPEHDW